MCIGCTISLFKEVTDTYSQSIGYGMEPSKR